MPNKLVLGTQSEGNVSSSDTDKLRMVLISPN